MRVLFAIVLFNLLVLVPTALACAENYGYDVSQIDSGVRDDPDEAGKKHFFITYEICQGAGPDSLSHVTFELCPSYIPSYVGVPGDVGCDDSSHLCLDVAATADSCDSAASDDECSLEKLLIGQDPTTGVYGVKFDAGINFENVPSSCTTYELIFNYDDSLTNEEPALSDMGIAYKQRSGCELAVVNGLSCENTCTDNIQNQGETGVDCGGPCGPCDIVNCCASFFVSGGICLDGFSPKPEAEWGSIACGCTGSEDDGPDCATVCCNEEADIPIGECPPDYCKEQAASTDGLSVTLNPADFTTEPECELVIPCEISTQEPTTALTDPSITGEISNFNDGNPLEPGTYRVTIIDGCMKYSGGSDFGWAVNARVDAERFYIIANSDRSQKLNGAPGTIGFRIGEGGFNTYEECVAAQQSVDPVNFTITQPHVVGIYLQDFPYTDNISGGTQPGGTGPIWKLECLTCGPCE